MRNFYFIFSFLFLLFFFLFFFFLIPLNWIEWINFNFFLSLHFIIFIIHFKNIFKHWRKKNLFKMCLNCVWFIHIHIQISFPLVFLLFHSPSSLHLHQIRYLALIKTKLLKRNYFFLYFFRIFFVFLFLFLFLYFHLDNLYFKTKHFIYHQIHLYSWFIISNHHHLFAFLFPLPFSFPILLSFFSFFLFFLVERYLKGMMANIIAV